MSIKKRTPATINSSRPAKHVKTARRRLTSGDARHAILNAAESILLRKGPQDMKLTALAKAAMVTTGNILHHFGSIDAVHQALLEGLVTRLIDRVIDITKAPWTEDQRMTLGIKEMFEAFEEKSSARLAAWLVMTGRPKHLNRMKDSIAQVRLAIRQARRSGVSQHITDDEIDKFVLLGITLALGAGLFGRDLSELFGLEENAARNNALGALLLLAALSRENVANNNPKN
jgi:AcrR family transcriptional regulator